MQVVEKGLPGRGALAVGRAGSATVGARRPRQSRKRRAPNRRRASVAPFDPQVHTVQDQVAPAVSERALVEAVYLAIERRLLRGRQWRRSPVRFAQQLLQLLPHLPASRRRAGRRRRMQVVHLRTAPPVARRATARSELNPRARGTRTPPHNGDRVDQVAVVEAVPVTAGAPPPAGSGSLPAARPSPLPAPPPGRRLGREPQPLLSCPSRSGPAIPAAGSLASTHPEPLRLTMGVLLSTARLSFSRWEGFDPAFTH